MYMHHHSEDHLPSFEAELPSLRFANGSSGITLLSPASCEVRDQSSALKELTGFTPSERQERQLSDRCGAGGGRKYDAPYECSLTAPDRTRRRLQPLPLPDPASVAWRAVCGTVWGPRTSRNSSFSIRALYVWHRTTTASPVVFRVVALRQWPR